MKNKKSESHFDTRYVVLMMVMVLPIFCTEMMNVNADPIHTDTIHIFGSDNFPPYEFTGEDGQPSGFDVDVLKTLLERTGIPYKITLVKWTEAQRMYQKGKSDIILGMYKNEEREKRFNFGLSYSSIYHSAVYRRGNRPFYKIIQLHGKKVILERGDEMEIRLRKEGLGINIIYVDNIIHGLKMLSEGKGDVVICAKETANYIIKEQNLSNLDMSALELLPDEYSFICKDKSIISRLDSAMMEIRRDGTYQKLYEKWFNHYDESKITNIILTSAGAILLLTLIFLAFFKILRNNIAKTKKELSDQNRRLALAIHAGDIEVFRYDIEEGIFYNVQWDNIPDKGRSMEEELNMIHPADQQVFMDSFNKLVHGEDYHKRISIRTHVENYKEWRYIEKEFSTLKDEKGRITTIIGTQRDITERQKMKEQLQESISKMQCAIASSNLILWEFSTEEMVFKSRNDNMFKIKGFVTQNIFELEKKIHPDDKDNVKAHIHVMAEGKNEDFSTDLRMWYNTDKEWHFCSASATPFETDDKGKVTRYVGSISDNTQIIKLNEDLKNFSEKLNYILLSSGIKMWEYDINLHLFRLKSALNSTLETTTVEDFIKQVDQPQQVHAKELIEKMDSKSLDASSIQLKITNSLDDDEIHYFIYDAIPLRDKKNNIVSYFGLERDVTGLIQIQIKLEEEKQKAQTADRLKSAFLANMSHEIRTPLNAIIGFSQLLCDTNSEEDKKEFVNIIIKNNDALLRLINDILEQSKIEAGVIDFKNTLFDMADNFNMLILSLQQRCTSPKVEFISSNPYKKCIVKCDSERLNQIITNFTTNAIKHTESGHIKVEYRYEDKGLKISVEDTGSGIPEEDKERIFRRFEKLNDFIQGTGLGLPICKSITDAYGGKIGVESVLRNGSTFWAWIPCEMTEIEDL